MKVLDTQLEINKAYNDEFDLMADMICFHKRYEIRISEIFRAATDRIRLSPEMNPEKNIKKALEILAKRGISL